MRVFLGHKDALYGIQLRHRRGCTRSRVDAAVRFFVVRGRIVHGQCLNGQGEHVGLVRGGDFGGAGEPGAQFAVGIVERDDHLEVLGLLGSGSGLRSGHAGRAQQRLIADQGHVAFEDFVGQRVHGHVGGLARLHVHDVGLIHLHLGGDYAHVGERHQRGAFAVLNSLDDGFALAHRFVGHDAVEGRGCDGLVEQILIGLEVGDGGLQMAAGGIGLRLGLVEARDSLGQSRDVEIVGGLVGFIVLLRHDAGFVERLRAIPLELFLLQIGLRVLHIGLGGLFGSNIGIDVGFGGGDGGLLSVDRRLLLHAFDSCKSLALLYVIAFLHVEAGNAAKRRGAYVHVGFGFDLAGTADHLGQILARHGGGEHLGISGLLPDHHESYEPGGNQHSESNEENFLHSHSFLGVDLLSSVREVEAIGSVKSRLGCGPGCRRVAQRQNL